MKYLVIISLIFITNLFGSLNTAQDVFKTYCWGCHHQTSMAFGPSFSQIANSRTKDQIITHISSPKSDYKQLGYKRTVMPSFGTTLNKKELDLIVEYILEQKGKK
jgi:mono/diheme cytochrome c family protein